MTAVMTVLRQIFQVTGLGHCTICRKVITTCCLLKCVPSTLSFSTVAFFAYLPNGIRSP